MVLPLIRRGLLAGVIAGFAAGLFAFLVGEPLVQDAIDIEQAASAQASLAPHLAHIGGWPVSRPQQQAGLFLATMLYGAAIGTLFALGFAICRGRVQARDDWQLATRLAAVLFAAVVLLPFLKYPANPPAVGDPDTIGERTWQYLAMIAGGLAAFVAAVRVRALVATGETWKRQLAGGGTFVALATLLYVAMPRLDEVPPDFPPSLLWEFRLSSLGTQAVLWAGLGVGYGLLSVRASARQRAGAPVAA